MTHDDRDCDLASVLRAFDTREEHSPADMDRLAARIVSSASPLLDTRRAAPVAWWAIAASWARMLIPVGATATIVAALVIAWAEHRAARPSTLARNAPDVLLQRDDLSQRLLFSLVAPVEQQVLPPSAERPRGQR